ncbi:hypothetical protein ACQR3P_03990 [Rhodococcus sp. IEGM1300]
MKNVKVKALGAVLAAFAIVNCYADEPEKPGEGTLFRNVRDNNSDKSLNYF